MQSSGSPFWRDFLIAVAFASATMLVRHLLDPYLGNRQPFTPIHAATALAVWLFGWRPAVISMIVCQIAASYLFTPPRYSLAPVSGAMLGVLTYYTTAVIIVFFGERARSSLKEVERRVSERTAERNALQRDLARVEEGERQRIARELHDQLGQHLTAMAIRVALIRKDPRSAPLHDQLAALETLTRSADDDLDLLVWQLRSGILENVTLAEALEEMTSTWSRNVGIPVELRTPGFEEVRLTAEVETMLFRVAQESLNNVAKHAQAKRVEIALCEVHGDIGLTVRDDGVGFDPARPLGTGTFGLAGMHERAALVGGTVKIVSSIGNGTTVTFTVPHVQAQPPQPGGLQSTAVAMPPVSPAFVSGS